MIGFTGLPAVLVKVGQHYPHLQDPSHLRIEGKAAVSNYQYVKLLLNYPHFYVILFSLIIELNLT